MPEVSGHCFLPLRGIEENFDFDKIHPDPPLEKEGKTKGIFNWGVTENIIDGTFAFNVASPKNSRE